MGSGRLDLALARYLAVDAIQVVVRAVLEGAPRNGFVSRLRFAARARRRAHRRARSTRAADHRPPGAEPPRASHDDRDDGRLEHAAAADLAALRSDHLDQRLALA